MFMSYIHSCAVTLARTSPFVYSVSSVPIVRQSSVTSEVTRQETSLERESLDDNDVERNADLYIFNHEVAQS